ncbi:MAG: heme ABC exporter ATP-binding protein CcmA [Calditrichaeota bacterium]|nr:heme ABC exporter ATP-binding protein CcmA [Calditrichota bacterium]
MIKVRNISKSFASNQALQDVTFQIQKGQFVTLLGANGAGKTTLTRILATLTRPTKGTVQIAGYAIDKDPIAVRRQIGVMSHFSFLYGDLSAEENLHFYGKMYGVQNLQNRIDELLHQVNLHTRRYDLVRTFSRGMQQRLSLARAILHHPDILLLDEPFAGLDVNAHKMLNDLLHNFIAHDSTVLLTTHDIDYAVNNSHRLIIIKDGRVIADDPTASITTDHIKNLLADKSK